MLAILLAAQPVLPHANAFWNVKAPADWSVEEVRVILRQSPWATVSAATMGSPVRFHLASAKPMQEAEVKERQALRYRVQPGANFEDYQAMLKEGRCIVLAVLLPDATFASDAIESRSLERDSVLHIGRRAYKLLTHFPPTEGDPYLRYVFPREVKPSDKSLMFEIYVPGLSYPQRHLEFDLREMVYKGKLEY